MNSHQNGVVPAHLGQHGAAGGQSEAGDDQGDPGAPAQDVTGHWWDHHGHCRHRERVQSRPEWRQSSHDLEIQRVQEEEAAEGGEGGHGDRRRPREGHRAGETQIDQGILPMAFPEEQAEERDARQQERGDDHR